MLGVFCHKINKYVKIFVLLDVAYFFFFFFILFSYLFLNFLMNVSFFFKNVVLGDVHFSMRPKSLQLQSSQGSRMTFNTQVLGWGHL